MQNHDKFEKYNELGAYHWRNTYSGIFRGSSPRNHALYDVPIDLVRQKLGVNLTQAIGADIGCGDGVLVYKVMQKGGRIIGVDLSKQALNLAIQEIGQRLGQVPMLINASCYNLPFGNEVFDYVIATELIEHLEFDRKFISEVVRVLKPGGVFVCTTPRKLPYGPEVQDPYHVKEYSADELRKLLSEFLEDVEILGLYPAWLDKIYLNKFPRPIALLVRFSFKLLSLCWNPYRHIIYQNASNDTPCANLIGIGRKSWSN